LDRTTKVAVVRAGRRRGAVAEAFALISDDLRERVQADPSPLIVPSLETPNRPWACTHRDTISAAADALLAAGASAITIAGATAGQGRSASACFDGLGYRTETWGRPVNYLAADSEDNGWSRIHWISPRGEPVSFRIPSQVAASRCRVSLCIPRTHGVYRLGLGLANMANILHPRDRPLVGTIAATTLDSRSGGTAAASVLESCRGLATRGWLVVRSFSGGMHLTPRELERLRAIQEATNRLAALAAFLPSGISVVDAFHAMQGEGPRHGGRVSLEVVIAGTDAVAVDAVAASVMGFEPMEVPYLRLAHAMGLGQAELSTIRVVGETIPQVRRPILRHSHDAFLRLVPGQVTNAQARTPRPHFGAVPASRRADQAER
jgi:uncharacterized protein (DUF362 family)